MATHNGFEGNVEFGQEQEKRKESGESSSSVHVRFNPSDSFLYIEDGAAITIPLRSSEEEREIDLTKLFLVPYNHHFYCPTCRGPIDKVLFSTTRQKSIPPIVTGPTIPQGPHTNVPVQTPGVGPVVPGGSLDTSGGDITIRCSACFTLLFQKGKEFFTGLASHFAGPTTETETVIPIPPQQPEIRTRERSKGLEILKSIVYGGLEILASLSVVTSSASADASTLSIVALSIANLIGGLFVLAHNLRDLKASEPIQEASTETEEAPSKDKYYELLGNRENFVLHAFVAILSFLIFGLVPPIVYGFSFRESDDKDLKLAAVAGASIICIALLAIAKAYVQRGSTYVTYIKTISFYVTSGVLASLLTYLAGTFFKRLVEQLGWFEPRSNFGFLVPEMSIVKSVRSSY